MVAAPASDFCITFCFALHLPSASLTSYAVVNSAASTFDYGKVDLHRAVKLCTDPSLSSIGFSNTIDYFVVDLFTSPS